MADNSKYTLGFDLYEGNTITSWPALKNAAGFVYLRTSLGLYKDQQFISFAQKAAALGMQVGAYHETWPNLGISSQWHSITSQMEAAGVRINLPIAIAYEIQTVADPKRKGKYVETWANPKDLAVYMQTAPSWTIVYTNMEGLGIIAASGVDYHAWQWWLADYMKAQGLQGEYPVDTLVSFVQKKYNISPQSVLFVQTADSIPYRDKAISPDKGADYDRAYSYQFTPAPLPEPDPTTDIAVRLSGLQSEIDAMQVQLNDIDIRLDRLEGKPNPTHPEPPVSGEGIWTLKTYEEIGKPHNGSFSAIAGHGQSNAIVLGQAEIDFTFGIKGAWYGYATDNSRMRAWGMSKDIHLIYVRLVGTPDNPTQVDDPIILCSSTDFMRQQVHVLEFSDDGQHLTGRPGRVARIEAIPREQTTQAYAAKYSPALAPWLFAWAWTNFKDNQKYGPSHVFPNGDALVFVKPLFDPGSTFPYRSGTIRGFWIGAEFLKERIK